MKKDWYQRTVRYYTSEGMVVDPDWRMLVTTFEGLRLSAYQDSVGVWTIGYGHTLAVKKGDQITEERAEELLFADVKRFEKSVNRLIEVPLTQYQFNALVSFTFNLGGGALRDSTLRAVLNQRDYLEAERQFARWVYAAGERLRGLERRRRAEATMFSGRDWRKYL